MSTHSESSGDLFQSNAGKESVALDALVDSGASKVSSRAGAAQKSARLNKKSSSAFRTISEVANDLGVQQHVLRFWETKFSQVKPLKRGGGRRYYRPEDICLLQAIYNLLYVEGYTIKGVQKLLRDVGKKQIVASFSAEVLLADAQKNNAVSGKYQGLNEQQREVLNSVLAELKDLRGMIKSRN